MKFRRRPSRTPIRGAMVFRGICRYCGCEVVPGDAPRHDECRRRQQQELNEFLPRYRPNYRDRKGRAPERPASGA
jgi:hypothetical protein